MSRSFSDFLFFCEAGDELPGWDDTLAVLGGAEDKKNALIRRLVSFAAEFSLAGNLWQQWLTYVLMMHENAFTLTCERETLAPDATAAALAGEDLKKFMELFSMRSDSSPDLAFLRGLTDYHEAYAEKKPNRAGRKIAELSVALAASGNLKEFSEKVCSYYASFGVGIFGLFKAFRISGDEGRFGLIPVTDDTDVCFDDLIGLEEQKKTLRANTEAFLNGKRANNVLLYGDSGTGKSTSVHALMHDYYAQGLRLVELSKPDRALLPRVLAAVKKRNYHFIIFLDDLSFEENESEYKELKAMLEGALEKRADRVLIYATSNRRHLIRETWSDRRDMEYQDDIHHSDTMEEKLSLASRFGVAIYYSKPNAKEYLHIVQELTARSGIEMDARELCDTARKWELRHGGMSGRTASQLIAWIEGSQISEHNDLNQE